MKSFLEGLATILLLVALAIIAWKSAQKYCWNNQKDLFSPPSLTSWDPTERAEAARRAGQKFGGIR